MREAAWPAITGENGAEGKGEARAAGGNRQTVDRCGTVGLANLEIHKKRKKKKRERRRQEPFHPVIYSTRTYEHLLCAEKLEDAKVTRESQPGREDG